MTSSLVENDVIKLPVLTYFLDVCIKRDMQLAGKSVELHIKDTAGCVSNLLTSDID